MRIMNRITALIRSAWSTFDIWDVCIFGGWTMLGYGLYLLKGLPVALIICGPLLMLIGGLVIVLRKI